MLTELTSSYYFYYAQRLIIAVLLLLFVQKAWPQAPVINSFTPTIGGQSSPINIKGKNFIDVTMVTFGGTASSFFYTASDSEIVAYVSNGASGAVAVTTILGNVSKPGFTFVPPPVLTSISPASGGLGDTITIKGSYFINVSNVYFGDSVALSFGLLSDTVIKAVVGNGSSGQVIVSTIGGDGSITGFTYLINPSTLLKLCPAASTTITSNIGGGSYQWQLSTNNGSSFSNISNNINYNGTSTNLLQLNNLPSSFTGYRYRCVVNAFNSNQYIVQFVNNWTGAANSFWNNTANWSCGVLPDTNTDVLINSGIVVLNSNGICRSITALSGVKVTVNTGFTLTVSH